MLALSMSKPATYLRLFTLLCLLASSSHAQVMQAAGTLMRGKGILEFYEEAIENPQQVLLLSLEIRRLFHRSSTGYKDLNNGLAQKMGWFNYGSLELESMELKPEPSQSHQYGYYSITLKKLTSKQCEALANHTALNQNFVHVELNGSPVSSKVTPQRAVAVCKTQWFFQDGKNEVKYVAY